ncbi:glutamine--fructose-6-phosphate transaminase (isomerizing) [Candidatus Woesearchaeota archaeon CG10_big_fil_rev_8_21_14_0_10_45_16]|nr:MAG: glutamine--fructose-6-phosphate transaminase (isomerizing) [Candidatus Woesearchaeota archaeon CG10_big_fil_rev_8_21_14_0_10_45_16]
MCGIAGYIGLRQASPLLLEALRRLEYRGYDSVGMAIQHDNCVEIRKGPGKVAAVDSECHFAEMPGTLGISHTRWSTHGGPSQRNAHPFFDASKRFAVVHNGIIENYLELKELLRRDGVVFSSDTDSEVIVHLTSQNFKGDLLEAVRSVVKHLQGAYAFCVINNVDREIIVARNGSPLVIGIGQGENFIGSDVSAFVEHTKKVMYLDDFSLARITKDNVQVSDFAGNPLPLQVKTIDWDLEQAQKQGYKHFMLKEIFEQPQVAQDSLKQAVSITVRPARIIIVACGTASYAGYVGKYLIEKLADVPVINEIASEFRYQEPPLSKDDLVVAISQSGETADTLAAVRLAKKHGVKTLGLINVVDSTIAREVDQVIYTRAGPEIGVASTKAFMSQLVTLYKVAYSLADRTFDPQQLVSLITKVLEMQPQVKEIAQKYYHHPHFLYIGRNRNFPLALEGALKLKEISYIHAEAYAAGELKHGPIALVSDEMPTVALCPQDQVYAKTISNIEEIKARQGRIISIATEGDERIKSVSDDVLYVPKVDDILYPFMLVVPLQLLAYHIADLKGCDIDKPRNLAKSVTVE